MKYCVLNERGKFCAKYLLHYTDIVNFVLDHFIVTHPRAYIYEYDRVFYNDLNRN